MKKLIHLIREGSIWMNVVAEAVLVIMMMLTVTDVVLRAFGKPIVGTYELVAMAGAVVIGFAVPKTSWERGHVFVDFLIENRSPAIRNGFFVFTRIVGMVIYGLLSWSLLLKGTVLHRAGEVSLTLRAPVYPAAFALSLCFFVQVFVLVADILRINENKEQKEEIAGVQR